MSTQPKTEKDSTPKSLMSVSLSMSLSPLGNTFAVYMFGFDFQLCITFSRNHNHRLMSRSRYMCFVHHDPATCSYCPRQTSLARLRSIRIGRTTRSPAFLTNMPIYAISIISTMPSSRYSSSSGRVPYTGRIEGRRRLCLGIKRRFISTRLCQLCLPTLSLDRLDLAFTMLGNLLYTRLIIIE